ncbi:MAG: L,D-transpeptidase [Firmicutes bacterium]|nr:L,D-transpeptidase [Bacillota bacterium]
MIPHVYRSLIGLAALAVMIATAEQREPPHGDPASLFAARPVVFATAGPRVGIKAPVSLTTEAPLTAPEVQGQLTVIPRLPLIIQPMSPHHFLIMPRGTWPGNTTIRFVWHADRAETTLTTDDSRRLTVDLSTQMLIAWEGGRVVRTIPIATGVAPRWTTPSGTFWIYRRVRDDHMVGGQGSERWDVAHVPYAQYFDGPVAFHGAWWNHHFGRPASHGCIQLPTARGPQGPTGDPPDAEWLWQFADIGTPVTIYGTTPHVAAAGPLRYPTDPANPHCAKREKTLSAARKVRSTSSSVCAADTNTDS